MAVVTRHYLTITGENGEVSAKRIECFLSVTQRFIQVTLPDYPGVLFELRPVHPTCSLADEELLNHQDCMKALADICSLPVAGKVYSFLLRRAESFGLRVVCRGCRAETSCAPGTYYIHRECNCHPQPYSLDARARYLFVRSELRALREQGVTDDDLSHGMRRPLKRELLETLLSQV